MITHRYKIQRLFLIGVCTLMAGFAVHWGLAHAAAQTLTPSSEDQAWADAGGLDVPPLQNGAFPDRSESAADTAPLASAQTDLRRTAFDPITITPAFTTYLPLVARDQPIMTEARALWVTRFDWTSFGKTATPADIDAIVDQAAAAHFNMLLFQVRGTADAYYSSTLEPWAARLTGSLTATLGLSPGWDPLAYLITRAHADDIQVHAYINVYPTWLCGLGAPPDPITPAHLFWTLSHATNWSDWRMWDSNGPMNIDTCGSYLWATPALSLTRQHVVSVALDLAARYDIDGIHLDNVRYAGAGYSYDPYTWQAFTDALAISPTLVFTDWRGDFQRAQVSALVAQLYSATTAAKPNLWVSAAVWPDYATGYYTYFQDSKSWLASGIVDANMPMLYSSSTVNNVVQWIIVAQNFLADSAGRFVLPGIGVKSGLTCVPFADLQTRIAAARAMGTPGETFFSYGEINDCGYWDDFANGPYSSPAVIPHPDWKP